MKITRILGLEVSVPPQPVLGHTPQNRPYFVLRLETDAGLIGAAISRPNGTPLLSFIKMLAPYYLGKNPLMRVAATAEIEQAHKPNFLALRPTVSLFDVAMWDIVAKHAKLPLYRMLGGARTKVPLMPMIGNFINERNIDSVKDEAKELLDQGYRRFKLPIVGNVKFEAKYVEEIFKLVDGELSVDYHWSFLNYNAALAACRTLDDLGLHFIEDPFPAQFVDLTCKLAGELRTPMAAGEDMTSFDDVRRAVSELGLYRLDATRCGGITGTIKALSIADVEGRAAVPLTSPELHSQLAGAFPAIEAVECIHRGERATPEAILSRPIQVADGFVRVDDEPGAGWHFDWEAVAKHTVDTTELTAS
jgi:L-alanine-DL-glutamate epimerase-like enolase superfamily enzyme